MSTSHPVPGWQLADQAGRHAPPSPRAYAALPGLPSVPARAAAPRWPNGPGGRPAPCALRH